MDPRITDTRITIEPWHHPSGDEWLKITIERHRTRHLYLSLADAALLCQLLQRELPPLTTTRSGTGS